MLDILSRLLSYLHPIGMPLKLFTGFEPALDPGDLGALLIANVASSLDALITLVTDKSLTSPQPGIPRHVPDTWREFQLLVRHAGAENSMLTLRRIAGIYSQLQPENGQQQLLDKIRGTAFELSFAHCFNTNKTVRDSVVDALGRTGAGRNKVNYFRWDEARAIPLNAFELDAGELLTKAVNSGRIWFDGRKPPPELGENPQWKAGGFDVWIVVPPDGVNRKSLNVVRVQCKFSDRFVTLRDYDSQRTDLLVHAVAQDQRIVHAAGENIGKVVVTRSLDSSWAVPYKASLRLLGDTLSGIAVGSRPDTDASVLPLVEILWDLTDAPLADLLQAFRKITKDFGVEWRKTQILGPDGAPFDGSIRKTSLYAGAT